MEHARDRLPLVLDRSRMAGAPGLIAFDGGAQHVLQIGLVVPLDRVVETLERRDQLGVSQHRLRVLEDARVARAGGVLADEQFLVELLAAPEPNVLDGDVAVGVGVVAHFKPRKADMVRARSSILTGVPMSSTNTSPPLAMAPA